MRTAVSHNETQESFGNGRSIPDYFSLIPGQQQPYALPMNSLNPQTSRPNEDLDAVIGRFQAWTMTQTQTKPSAKNAVSEISYEQALRATARYHRPEATIPPLPQAAAWKAEPAVTDDHEDFLEELDVPVTAPARKSQHKHNKSARKAASPKRTSTAANASATASPTFKKPKHTKESFAQVLRKETGLARTESNALRSSALTVRLSQDESALIKARADEAQLSTSAYLRQCALEVESLREQVRETLAKFHQPTVTTSASMPTLALPPAASPSKPGLFGGLRNWLIRRLGGQQVDAVC